MFSVRHSGAPEFTDETWQRYFAFLAMMRERFQASLSSRTWQELKERMQAFMRTGEDVDDVVIMQGDEVVGWLDLRVRRSEEQGVMAFASFDTSFETIPAAYVKLTAAELGTLLAQRACTSAYCMTTNPRASDLAAAWDGRRLSRIDRYRLQRAKANTRLIKQWLTEYPGRYSGYRTIFFESVPEEYLDRYIELMQQFIGDMPKEHEEDLPFVLDRTNIRRFEETRRAAQTHLYTVALLDDTGLLIGHSNVSINGRNPKEVYQVMTGIDRGHRGKGLSRWLKSALYMRVGEDFPDNESFVTDMRAVNEPILSVNTRMGYELLSRGHEYRIELDALRGVAQGQS